MKGSSTVVRIVAVRKQSCWKGLLWHILPLDFTCISFIDLIVGYFDTWFCHCSANIVRASDYECEDSGLVRLINCYDTRVCMSNYSYGQGVVLSMKMGRNVHCNNKHDYKQATITVSKFLTCEQETDTSILPRPIVIKGNIPPSYGRAESSRIGGQWMVMRFHKFSCLNPDCHQPTGWIVRAEIIKIWDNCGKTSGNVWKKCS